MAKIEWEGKAWQIRGFGHESEKATFKGECAKQGKDYREVLLYLMDRYVKNQEGTR